MQTDSSHHLRPLLPRPPADDAVHLYHPYPTAMVQCGGSMHWQGAGPCDEPPADEPMDIVQEWSSLPLASQEWSSLPPPASATKETLAEVFSNRHPLDVPIDGPQNLIIYLALSVNGLWNEGDQTQGEELNSGGIMDSKLTEYAIQELLRRNTLDMRVIALFALVLERIVMPKMKAAGLSTSFQVTGTMPWVQPSDPTLMCTKTVCTKTRLAASVATESSPFVPRPMKHNRKALYANIQTDYREYDRDTYWLDLPPTHLSPDYARERAPTLQDPTAHLRDPATRIYDPMPGLLNAGLHRLVYGPYLRQTRGMEYTRPLEWLVHRCICKLHLTVAQMEVLPQHIKESDVLEMITRMGL
ncbi:hypothetical protein K525DRAFT_281136 [Schizophyllum commune Loenen D]|nr:hypothetical protein K525DRAFT_281136 [Schizophyllum commune Loenen D]